MIVRPLAESDYARLCALSDQINDLHHQYLPGEFLKPVGEGRDATYWRAFLRRDAAAIQVAEQDEHVVGFVATHIKTADAPFLVARPVGYIATLVVDWAARRQGVGRALIRAAERRLVAAGAVQIRLEVMAFNAPAMAFYQALGFASFSQCLSKPVSDETPNQPGVVYQHK